MEKMRKSYRCELLFSPSHLANPARKRRKEEKKMKVQRERKRAHFAPLKLYELRAFGKTLILVNWFNSTKDLIYKTKQLILHHRR